jgi:hypothetical protein
MDTTKVVPKRLSVYLHAQLAQGYGQDESAMPSIIG